MNQCKRYEEKVGESYIDLQSKATQERGFNNIIIFNL